MEGSKAVERMWLKLESKIKNTIVNKLHLSFNIQSMSHEESLSEMMHVFFDNFYKVYETENQYMRFIFVVFKRKMIDLYNRERRYYKTHKAVLNNIS